MEDLARAVEMRAERLVREVEDMAASLGLVEVDILVGEEPEEGVELEVVAVDAWTAANDWVCGGEMRRCGS